MSDSASQQPVKPRSACLGCRRRKVKCSREPEGCQDCAKFDLPCVYPTPAVGVKRKRGPYKKDKAPRERHLEDLVRYLQPNNNSAQGGYSESSSANEEERAVADPRDSAIPKPSRARPSLPSAPSPNDLVRDALVALTNTSEIRREHQDDVSFPHDTLSRRKSCSEPTRSVHPPVRRVFEYWYLYVLRVDPLVKLIHVPTFAKKLFYLADDLSAIPDSTEAMMYSMYYAVISSCTPREVRHRFGENRIALKRRYGKALESALADNYGVPNIELIQALVLYLVGRGNALLNLT